MKKFKAIPGKGIVASQHENINKEAEETLEYFKLKADELAKKYGFVLSDAWRYPDSIDENDRFCVMNVTIVDTPSSYNIEYSDNFLSWLESDRYCVAIRGATIQIMDTFPEDFSKQEIDDQLKAKFKLFQDKLESAENKLDNAEELENEVDDLIKVIEETCESNGCEFYFQKNGPRNDTGLYNESYILDVYCTIEVGRQKEDFNIRKYLNKSTKSVVTSIEKIIKKLKTEDTEGDISYKESWDGTFSPKFIMTHSKNIPDEGEAQKLADFIWEGEYDAGFRTREEFLRAYDFDDLYDMMKQEE